MPTALTEDPTDYAPQITPPDGGEPRNATSIRNFAQQLANRTAYLNAALFTNGVSLIRNGTAAAMVALTSAFVSTNSLFYVVGQGIYSYSPSAAYAVDNLFVYTATGMGGGQWIDISFLKSNVANGVAKLTGTAKIPSNQLANSTQAMLGGAAGIAIQATASSSLVDIPTYSLGVPNVLVGDLLFIHWTLNLYNDTAGSTACWQPVVVDGAAGAHPIFPTAASVNQSSASSPNTTTGPQSYSYLYTVNANPGSYTLKAQFCTLGGGNAKATSPSSITCLQVRP